MSGKTTHELVIDLINNNDTGLLDRMIELAEAGAYSKDSTVFSNPTKSLLQHLNAFDQYVIINKLNMGFYNEDLDTNSYPVPSLHKWFNVTSVSTDR